MSANLTDQDYELLSDYLDGGLTEDERLALEERLANDADLRRELAYFRQTVALISQLPELQAPRNFTLDAKMIGPRVLPRPTVRRRFNISVLSAVAATFIVIIGAMVVLSLMSPSIGNIFSDVVNGLQTGGSGGAAPPVNQVAQAPTPVPSPMPSTTLNREEFTETNESQDDFNGAGDANVFEPPTPSPTLLPADGLTAGIAQEESLDQATNTLESTEKVAADPAPIVSLTATATVFMGYLADVTGSEVGADTQTASEAEMQVFAEGTSELDNAATTGRVMETVIPPGAGGETSPAMPSIAMEAPASPTETVIAGAMAAAQPTITAGDEAENAQRDRRDALDFTRIIIVGTVLVSVGVIVFVLQRQTP